MAASAAEILSPPTTPSAPPDASASSTAATPPTVPSGWWDSLKNPDAKAWVANKAYADVDVLATSAMSSEKLLGADKAGRTVVLPKDDNDAEGRKAFYSKIGVPDTPEGYKLPLPTGDDGVFAKTASQWFHEAGVPAKAAEKVAERWNAFIESQVKTSEEADAKTAKDALEALKVEWAHEFDAKGEIARRGMREVGAKAGLDDADLKKLEASLGTAKLLKMFEQIGGYTGESPFNGGGGGSGFGSTPAKAQARIDELTAERTNGKITQREFDAQIGPLIEIVTRTAKAS